MVVVASVVVVVLVVVVVVVLVVVVDVVATVDGGAEEEVVVGSEPLPEHATSTTPDIARTPNRRIASKRLPTIFRIMPAYRCLPQTTIANK